MGPTNISLVKLSQADKAWRDAVARLDAASHSVRVQERRLTDLREKLAVAQTKLREQQAKAGQLDLEIKTHDARIDRLRGQQQNAKNNKEYQTFLTEINTEKIDKAKLEEEAMKVLEVVETGQAEVKALLAHINEEAEKHAANKSALGGKLAELQADIDRIKPIRDQASASVPSKARDTFDRLADRYDGEAIVALSKPDRRREEYICSSCNMSLVTDLYNRIHTRDELVFCPNCQRLLYIPDDLPPEMAVGSGRAEPAPGKSSEKPKRRKVTPRSAKVADAGAPAGAESSASPVVIEQRAKGALGLVLSKAQGESVRSAVADGSSPLDFEVSVDGEVVGLYKGMSRDHLERYIRFYMNEAGLHGVVTVAVPPEDAPAEAPAEPAPGAEGQTAETAQAAASAPADAAPESRAS